MRPSRRKEARPWTQLVKEEEPLLTANLAVIPLRSLLLKLRPLLQLLRLGKGNTVDALEALSL